jgi:hypothetical protein
LVTSLASPERLTWIDENFQALTLGPANPSRGIPDRDFLLFWVNLRSVTWRTVRRWPGSILPVLE